MTTLERYQSQLAELERRKRALDMQYKVVESARLCKKIADIRLMIDAVESYNNPKPISHYVSKDKLQDSGVVELIIECHLAADYLADCADKLSDKMSEFGLEAIELVPKMRKLSDACGSLAGKLCEQHQTLVDVITDNDTLLDALHKKTQSYIVSRTKKAKREKKRRNTDSQVPAN